MGMWTVEIANEFGRELAAMDPEVRIELLAHAKLIERFGPQAKRPRVDTLNGSKHANMKELALTRRAYGEWPLH